VLAAAGLTAGGIWVGMDALEYFGPTASVPESAELSGPAPAAATDPFTLQVAAYLKQEYALKRMEDLKRQGLDAYWTETSSGGKIWFQVRVSHFPDLSTAREYGRKLKGKGVIEDFYVTNNVR
jgi:cell division protein FtsN